MEEHLWDVSNPVSFSRGQCNLSLLALLMNLLKELEIWLSRSVKKLKLAELYKNVIITPHPSGSWELLASRDGV